MVPAIGFWESVKKIQDGWLALLISAWMAVVAIMLCKELVFTFEFTSE